MGRISNKHGRLRQKELIQVIQAFLLGEITFALTYLSLSKKEEDTVSSSIRKIHKVALGVSVSASTQRVMATATINTFQELTEAYLSSQYHRLTTPEARRQILRQLDYAPPINIIKRHQLRPHAHGQYRIQPIPRNMPPEFHVKCQNLRAKALQRSCGHGERIRRSLHF